MAYLLVRLAMRTAFLVDVAGIIVRDFITDRIVVYVVGVAFLAHVAAVYGVVLVSLAIAVRRAINDAARTCDDPACAFICRERCWR